MQAVGEEDTWTTLPEVAAASAPSADGVPAATTGVAITTTAQSLRPGTGYRFRVRARNLMGFGPYSEPSVTFFTDAKEPEASPH
ncbi:unnamed protein product, partial [Discosporangium mesarthrocarpum]